MRNLIANVDEHTDNTEFSAALVLNLAAQEVRMILVRDVFRLKFGKAREALAAWKEMGEHARRVGMPPARILADLVGPYYTLVMETTAADLSTWEKEMRRGMDEEFRALYQKFTPLIDSGYREIFTIQDI